MRQYRHLLVILLLLPLVAGCASGSRATAVSSADNGEIDLSCSYFHFLKGTHAEYNQHFAEAFEAFETALSCDPTATYIEKKLPVLLFRQGETDKAATLLRSEIAKDPDDISQYLLLAHLAIQQNKRDEAIELYREVLKRDPANEAVRLRLGILSVQQDRFGEAEEIFRDLIAQNPELHLARIYLARLLQMTGNADGAAETYEEALRLNWSPELAFEIVDFYSAQERYDDALRLYDAVLANDSSNQKALIGRIQVLLTVGRDEDALVELRNLREENSNTNRLDMAIAKILLRLGKIDEATTLLEGLVEGESESEANYLLGLIAFQDKELGKALGYLEKIKADGPEYPDAVYLQVRILRNIGKTDEALALLKAATSTSEKRHPLFYALLSSLYQEQERMEEAMAMLTAGVIAFPQSEQLHFEHALLLERSGLTLQALAAMQRVLEISPENPEALNYIGYTWAELNINLEQARNYIRKALELKPDNGFIRDSLGWVEFRLGNFESALLELQEALKLEPNDPNIYSHLGDVYRALKRPADARKAYLKAVEIFDDEAEKGILRKKLDEL